MSRTHNSISPNKQPPPHPDQRSAVTPVPAVTSEAPSSPTHSNQRSAVVPGSRRDQRSAVTPVPAVTSAAPSLRMHSNQRSAVVPVPAVTSEAPSLDVSQQAKRRGPLARRRAQRSHPTAVVTSAAPSHRMHGNQRSAVVPVPAVTSEAKSLPFPAVTSAAPSPPPPTPGEVEGDRAFGKAEGERGPQTYWKYVEDHSRPRRSQKPEIQDLKVRRRSRCPGR